MHAAITDFLARNKHLQSDTDIATACEQEKTWLYDHYPITTCHKMMSQYRNAIRGAQLPAAFLVYMREPKEHMDTVNQRYNQDVLIRQRKQYPIVNVDALLERACQCLTYDSYTRIIVGLELLTGRRPFEIGVTAQFTPVSAPYVNANDILIDDHYVEFRGQAKTRGTRPTDFQYPIPVLAAVPDVCAALQRLRMLRSFAGYTAPQFDDTTGKTLRETRRSAFEALLPKGALKAKEVLRKIYGCVAFDWFAPHGYGVNAYLADFLGHKDANAANSYQDFYLATIQ